MPPKSAFDKDDAEETDSEDISDEANGTDPVTPGKSEASASALFSGLKEHMNHSDDSFGDTSQKNMEEQKHPVHPLAVKNPSLDEISDASRSALKTADEIKHQNDGIKRGTVHPLQAGVKAMFDKVQQQAR